MRTKLNVMRTKLKNTTSLAAISIMTGLATAAFSQNAVAQDPTTNWSGFYLGAHVGGGNADWSGTQGRVTADPNTGGALIGIHGGYNWQFNNVILGVEGDWDVLNDWEGFARDNSGHNIRNEVDSLASVRARIGIALGQDESVLLFLSAGAAFVDAEALVCSTSCSSSDGRRDFSFSDVGGVIGVGLEYAMSDNFRVRIDGSYYWFDDSKNLSDFSSARAGDQLTLEDIYTVRVAATYYFN